MSLRPAWSAKGVTGQPGLQRETLSLKKFFYMYDYFAYMYVFMNVYRMYV